MGQRRNPVLSLLALVVLAGCSNNPTLAPVAYAPAARPAVQTAAVAPSQVSAYINASEAIGKKPSGKPTNNQPQNVQNVELTGTVTKLLPQDNNGTRHEHFIFEVNGQEIHVAHNIDLAPVVPVQVGSSVTIKGDLIDTAPLDVLHWTHHDPAHVHPDGYILFNGRKYQ